MAFVYRLETADGAPADPPTLDTAVPNWTEGDCVPLSSKRMLRVIGKRDDDADQPPVLVVEDATDSADRPAPALNKDEVAGVRDTWF